MEKSKINYNPKKVPQKRSIDEKHKKRKPMKHRFLFRIASILMIVSTIVLIVMLIRMHMLGLKYIGLFGAVLFVLEVIILFILNKRFKVIVKLPFLVLSLVLSGTCIFGVYNLNLAANFVSKVVSATVQEEKYDLYVLVDSEYQGIDDLNKTKLGYFDNANESLDEAMRILRKQTTFKSETPYDDMGLLLKDCINKKTDVVYLSSSLVELMGEEYPDEFSRFRKIDEIVVSIKETTKKSNKDITKDPFLLYVSGIDTYGSIGTVSRSDVNMLIAVNPKTNKVLLVNTPRDYYVKLHTKKAMDKLTHAGIYGVEESMNTLGDLYASEVDYYLKINFSSLIKIVDAIGGITVDSKYRFSYDGFTFKKGKNSLNGKAALAFSRCRKELPGGDVSRGENQEAVIRAIIEKITKPAVISKFSSILKTMEKSFVTNMDEDDIYSFLEFQVNENPKWEIESQNASGKDSYQTTYSAGKTKLYVMMPDEESVTDVKHKLNEILEED